MPATTPMPTKNPGDVLTSALWNTYLRDNIDKLLTRGHRVLTVAQFAALTGLEGTKGSVPPDEVYLEVDSTNGIQWHLAYESGEPTYKWRVLGGAPMLATVDTNEAVSSASYVNLATVGPQLVTPRAGEYDFVFGVEATVAASSNAFAALLGLDARRISFSNLTAVANMVASSSRWFRDAQAAGVTVGISYRGNSATTQSFAYRWIRMLPVRLG